MGNWEAEMYGFEKAEITVEESIKGWWLWYVSSTNPKSDGVLSLMGYMIRLMQRRERIIQAVSLRTMGNCLRGKYHAGGLPFEWVSRLVHVINRGNVRCRSATRFYLVETNLNKTLVRKAFFPFEPEGTSSQNQNP